MVFLVYVVKCLAVNEENRVRIPKTPKRNNSKVGQCGGLKIRRYRFESYLFHNQEYSLIGKTLGYDPEDASSSLAILTSFESSCSRFYGEDKWTFLIVVRLKNPDALLKMSIRIYIIKFIRLVIHFYLKQNRQSIYYTYRSSTLFTGNHFG